MKNIIITGCGRSGTSMVAGCFAKSGYNMGKELLPSDAGNVKGYFEDYSINKLNEDILRRSYPKKRDFMGEWILDDENFLPGLRWLSSIPVNANFYTSEILKNKIKLLCKSPFCYKDPRFAYTLPVWNEFLEDVIFICVFRHPSSTARSILEERKIDGEFNRLQMSYEIALDIWKSIYSHILNHSRNGRWLFIHANQVLTTGGLKRIENFSGVKIDNSFPEKRLLKQAHERKLPTEIEQIYIKMCGLANYDVSL